MWCQTLGGTIDTRIPMKEAGGGQLLTSSKIPQHASPISEGHLQSDPHARMGRVRGLQSSLGSAGGAMPFFET